MKQVLTGCAIMFGVLILVVVVAVFYLGTMMEAGDVPDTAIVAGNKLSPAAREAIDSAVEIRPNEQIRYFYSSGLLDWNEDGNLITNQRVVSYSQLDGRQIVDEADYADIAEIRPYYSEEWLEDSTLTVIVNDGTEFDLLLSNENKLDRAAIDYVERQLADGADEPAEGFEADVEAELEANSQSSEE